MNFRLIFVMFDIMAGIEYLWRCKLSPRKKEDTKKPTANTKKTKSTATKKSSSFRYGKKKDPKITNHPPKKHTPSQKPVKKSEQNKPTNKKREEEFLSKAALEDTWAIENVERYVLAVRKAFEKIPEHEKEEIDLREIWVNSSLPGDLILKIITEHGDKMGIKKNSVYLDGKIVF